MTKTYNDKGEWVVAVGAPGSTERVKVEWPMLIFAIQWRKDTSDSCVAFTKSMFKERRIPADSILATEIMAVAGLSFEQRKEVSK